MRVITENPGLLIICRGCRSAYEVKQEDLTEVRPVEIMGFWRKLFRAFNTAYIGSFATWNCPVCGYTERKPLLDLPLSWLEKRKP